MEKLKGDEWMNVLIVENDPMVAMIIRQYIQKIGPGKIFGPLTSETVILQILEEQSIDLIVLEINLPHQSGLDLLQILRAKGYYTNVIIVTAANKVNDIQKAYAYGAIDYLIKPFEYERFQKAVEKHLHQIKCFIGKQTLRQEDIDQEKEGRPLGDALPKGLNEKTLSKILDILKRDSQKKWTLRGLASESRMSNVTIKKYMDHLEEIGMVWAELSTGQVGRPEYQYALKESLINANNVN